MIGETCMRENVKKTEARALTSIVTLFLPKPALAAALAKHPKIRYYVRRWTHWQLIQLYIITYKRLYFLAAKRGASLDPPLYSGRGNMNDDANDDIDLAVMDHMRRFGY